MGKENVVDRCGKLCKPQTQTSSAQTRWWTRDVLSSGFQLKITRYHLDDWDQQNVALSSVSLLWFLVSVWEVLELTLAVPHSLFQLPEQLNVRHF